MSNVLINATLTGAGELEDRTRLDLIEGERPDQTVSLLKPKVSWTPVTRNMHLSAGTREPLLHVFLSRLHTTQQEQTRLTRKGPKKKSTLPSDLWPGAQGGLPCMHKEEVQTEFMTALSLCLFLITSPPIGGHWKPPCWSRQTRHHSFTRLLGAFVRWLLGGKRKTDQYISHGPDR